MRKIISTSLFLIVAVAAIQLSSCKKKENNPSRSEQLVGAWKQTQTGTDQNGNGIWDESEITAVASANAINLIFNSDGTGTGVLSYMGFPVSGAITWTLANQDNDVNITISLASMPITTLNYTFINFGGGEFKVKDSSSPTSFNTFKKQ